jgi:Leucine-rich repeat (LRR) protein
MWAGMDEDDDGYDEHEMKEGLVLVEDEGSLVDDDGRELVFAGVTLPMPCVVGNAGEGNFERVVRIPLYSAKGVVPSPEDMLRLEPLLSAHSEAVGAWARDEHMQALAAQREGLDAGRLESTAAGHKHSAHFFCATFEPLLKLVQELQGVRVHTVELSDTTLGTEDADLVKLPAGLRAPAVCRNLIGLRVRSTMLSSLPSWLGELSHLETMHISGNGSADGDVFGFGLRTLPNCIQHLTRLRSLELIDLYGLESLPPSLGKLTQLERLTLEGNDCDLPSSLGKVSTNLTELCVRACDDLSQLPECIGAFTKLRRLELSGVALTDLPADLGALTDLRELHVDANLATLPVPIARLVGLRTLEVRDILGGAHHLTQLPPAIFAGLSNLTSLCIGCHSLTELSSSMLANLHLTSLALDGCRALRGPLMLAPMTALTALTISRCYRLSLTPPPLLQTLEVDNSDQMFKDLHGIMQAVPALRALTLKCTVTSPRNFRRGALALAHALPSLASLESLCLSPGQLGEGSLLMIGLALRAWPKPSLTLRSPEPSYYDFERPETELFYGLRQELGLPAVEEEEEEEEEGEEEKSAAVSNASAPFAPAAAPAAAATEWHDKRILRFFAAQQRKVEAFAGGLHPRLGAASKVACLDEHTLSLIVDEVLGRRVYAASLRMAARMMEEEEEEEEEEESSDTEEEEEEEEDI